MLKDIDIVPGSICKYIALSIDGHCLLRDECICETNNIFFATEDETPSEEPDQDKLWEEINEAIVQQIRWSGWSGPAIDRLKTQYTITRK